MCLRVVAGVGQRVVAGQRGASRQGQTERAGHRRRCVGGTDGVAAGSGVLDHCLYQRRQRVDRGRAGWSLEGRAHRQAGVDVDTADGDDRTLRSSAWQEEVALVVSDHTFQFFVGVGHAVTIGVDVDLCTTHIAVANDTSGEVDRCRVVACQVLYGDGIVNRRRVCVIDPKHACHDCVLQRECQRRAGDGDTSYVIGCASHRDGEATGSQIRRIG